MSVFDYINKKKEQHQARREAIQTARHEDKQQALLKITEQRKKLQKRVDTSEALTSEKAKIKKLKQREFKGSMAGKVVTGMKAKIKEGKAKGNVFTQGSGANNLFTQSSGSSPFTELGKKKGKQKSIF